jgi:hypothetical protein
VPLINRRGPETRRQGILAAARRGLAETRPAADKPATVVVLITNSRAVVLTKLEATPSDGTLPKAIVSNLAPGKKTSVKVATDKSCVFNLHGDYADGSSTDSTSVDLSRDKNVNLVE